MSKTNADLRSSNFWQLSENSKAGASPKIFGNETVYVGVDKIGNKLIPLLAFPNLKHPQKEFGGFSMKTERGTFGKDEVPSDYYCICCTEKDLEPVFFRFVDEILEMLSDGTAAAAAIDGAIASWQEFLSIPSIETLTNEVVLGLWGELTALKLISKKVGLKEAIQSWKGPEKADWDFKDLKDGMQIEVKTSSATEWKITVNGTKQLQSAPKSWLLFFRVEEDEINGINIVDLIQSTLAEAELKGIRGAVVRKEFWSKLKKVGYNPAHDAFLSPKKFKPLPIKWYRIDNSFPSIDFSQIPEYSMSRATEVKYRFDLAGLPDGTGPY